MERVETESAGAAWYFGYGSNMDPRTFLGRRKMRPFDVRVARLLDYELRFNLPIGGGERGVANVVPTRGAEVWGVAYRISARDGARLDRTEGVPRMYQRVGIQLMDEAGDPLTAFTYGSRRGDESRKPSRRYMGLLLAGARHHELPTDYVGYLRDFDLAIDERSSQRELFDD